MDKKPSLAVRNLYPHLSDDEFAEFAAGFDEYLQIVLQIFERSRPEVNHIPGHLTRDADSLSLNQPSQGASA